MRQYGSGIWRALALSTAVVSVGVIATVTSVVPAWSSAAAVTATTTPASTEVVTDIGDAVCVVAVSAGVQPCAGMPASTPAPLASPQPTAASTGVPAGTSLRRVDGNMTVMVAGTIIDSIDLYGVLRIEAANVTVKRSIIRGSGTTGAVVLYAGSAAVRNLLIEDVEISPTIRTHLTNGIFGHDMSLRRVNVHHVIDSVHIFGGDNVLIEDSYLHDNLHFGPDVDPGHSDGSHDDSVQIQGGRNITIRNSSLSGQWNAAVQVTQDRATVENLTIQNNWIAGGGCALNISEGTRGTIQGLTITGNSFGSTRFSCPILVTPATKAISVITNNTLVSGALVRLICRATTGNYYC